MNIIKKSMEKRIRINIIGEVGIGKARLTFMIKNCLKEHGSQVEHTPIDFATEQEFDSKVSEHYHEVIRDLKKDCIVTIEETYTYKEE